MEKETKQVDVQKFINDAGVAAILEKLRVDIGVREQASGKKFQVSDVYDGAGNQYVDLVQEGGGVWGVALLGYTYILEKMGIRFFSLAGTSAGAINTMLLAATGRKEDEKAEKIIRNLLELDMFCFVDGKPTNARFTKRIKKMIQQFILKKNYLHRIATAIKWLFILFGVFSIASFIMSIIFWNGWVQLVASLALAMWIIVIVLGVFLFQRVKVFAKSGYGLNGGKFFHEWITTILRQNNIDTLTKLKQHFSQTPDTLAVRRDDRRDKTMGDKEVIPPGMPMLTIVTSDITTGNKVEFPRMWELYWENTDQVNPADFVRASMSIPVFFETFKIPVLPAKNKRKEIWKNHLNWNGNIPNFVQLVDGGALSNFPINVFYNPAYIIPRMPTFGIRLGGTNIQIARDFNSISGYVQALISTLRSNTDKDFINRNKSFELGIQMVDVRKYSWLNFFMEDKAKQELFAKGALAAADFLRSFDWENYKKQRLDNYAVLQEQRSNPNNW
ncbi:MAG: patatin-like phospholipase family protein [Bacteroidota bacterium]